MDSNGFFVLRFFSFPLVFLQAENFLGVFVKAFLDGLRFAVDLAWIGLGMGFDFVAGLLGVVGLSVFQVQLLVGFVGIGFVVWKLKALSAFIEYWSWLILAGIGFLFVLTLVGVIK